jgi:hypothetical protein
LVRRHDPGAVPPIYPPLPLYTLRYVRLRTTLVKFIS